MYSIPLLSYLIETLVRLECGSPWKYSDFSHVCKKNCEYFQPSSMQTKSRIKFEKTILAQLILHLLLVTTSWHRKSRDNRSPQNYEV